VLTHPATTSVYSGACLVRHARADDPDVAGIATDTAAYKVKLPVDTAVAEGDVVTVTASTHDAGLVDVGLTVVSVRLDGWQISREAICEQIR
jgi:hypothetical protein